MNTQPTTEGSPWMSIRIAGPMRRELESLADRNERTLAAEIRIAIRKHLEAEKT